MIAEDTQLGLEFQTESPVVALGYRAYCSLVDLIRHIAKQKMVHQ